MSETLKKRLKSFGWRTGMMMVSACIAFAIDNATEMQIPAWGIVILGLAGGEVSKYLNTSKK